MTGIQIHREAMATNNNCIEECKMKFELIEKQRTTEGWREVPGYENLDFRDYLEEEFNLSLYELALNHQVYTKYFNELVKHGYHITYEVIRMTSRAIRYKIDEKRASIFQEIDEARTHKRKQDILIRLKKDLGLNKDRPSWKTEAILLNQELERLREENKRLKKRNKELEARVKYAEEHRRKVVQQLSHQF